MTPEKALDIAGELLDLVLEIVPAPVAQQMLTDADVRRANAIADAAEATKFTVLPAVLPKLDDPGDEETKP